MKKLAILLLFCIPLVLFGQNKLSYSQLRAIEKSEKESRLTASDHLNLASKKLIIGSCIGIGGSIVGSTLIYVSSRDDISYGASNDLMVAGIATAAVSAITGLIFTIDGYIEIGKAGHYPNKCVSSN
ncbi:MAG TPA: hypothetical protein GXX42_10595 [Petrimonas sp.]|uniref:hypothetical protein n=1 Tax=Petrimonas sp. TaxID=2023866 RepID=UPI00176E372F|nr:hypothetical protein [Petrimonas sp.]